MLSSMQRMYRRLSVVHNMRKLSKERESHVGQLFLSDKRYILPAPRSAIFGTVCIYEYTHVLYYLDLGD